MLGLVYLFSVGTGTDLAGAGVVLDHDDEQARLAVDAGLVDERGDVVVAAGLDRQPISAARCVAGLQEQVVVKQIAVAALERVLAGILLTGLVRRCRCREQAVAAGLRQEKQY